MKVTIELETLTKGPVQVTNVRHDGAVVTSEDVLISGYDSQGQPFEIDFYIKDLFNALQVLQSRPSSDSYRYNKTAYPTPIGYNAVAVERVSAGPYRSFVNTEYGAFVGGGQSAEIAPAAG